MRLLAPLLIAAVALPATALPARQRPTRSQPARPVDLAESVAGTYAGPVVSDARGSSGRQVVATVTRVSRNVVELSFDYPRVPTVRIPIQRAMDAIIAQSGHNNFLIELNKDPRRLDLTIDDVSMMLHKS